MQKELEAKRSAMIVCSQRLRSAGSSASADLKEGFESTYKELRDAIGDARERFA